MHKGNICALFQTDFNFKKLYLHVYDIHLEMKTIKEIYKIGKGPSSSHTMGPFKAVRNYLENHPDVIVEKGCIDDIIMLKVKGETV